MNFFGRTIDYRSIPATRDPRMGSRRSQEVVSLERHTVLGGYLIEQTIESNGTQATLYLAIKDSKRYAVKLYYSGFEPVDRVVNLITHPSCPYLLPLVDKGFYQDRYYYEVFPYYHSGTLDDWIKKGRCSPFFIEKVLLPALDGALLYLHSNGLVHGDLKPQNIFVSDDGSSVALGDYGVASVLKPAEGNMVPFRGTLEYAPPVFHQGELVQIDEGYDYGALGLVLIKAYTGYSLFSGMTLEERDAACARIDVPASVPPKARGLIKSLLKIGDDRAGHKECALFLGVDEMADRIRRQGRRGQRRSSGLKFRSARSFIEFGTINGECLVAYSLEDLLKFSEEYWNVGLQVLKMSKLQEFLFNTSGSNDLYEKSIKRYSGRQENERLFLFCSELAHHLGEAKTRRFVYGGYKFDSLINMFEQIEKEQILELSVFLESDLLLLYLAIFEYDSAFIAEAEKIVRRRESFRDKATLMLAVCRGTANSLDIEGSKVDTVDQLMAVIMNMSSNAIKNLSASEEFRAWLYVHHCADVVNELEGCDER